MKRLNIKHTCVECGEDKSDQFGRHRFPLDNGGGWICHDCEGGGPRGSEKAAHPEVAENEGLPPEIE